MTRLLFRARAIRRMFERSIGTEEILHVLARADAIETRPDDLPYPTRLLPGSFRGRPLHVLAADNLADDETIIVTVYEPDPALWQPGFRRRRRS